MSQQSTTLGYIKLLELSTVPKTTFLPFLERGVGGDGGGVFPKKEESIVFGAS